MSLFVTSQINKTVREYDVTTGAFLKVAASGGALGDPLDVVIGIDGNLLVSDGQTNQVKRYNRATGAFIDVFASTIECCINNAILTAKKEGDQNRQCSREGRRGCGAHDEGS